MLIKKDAIPLVAMEFMNDVHKEDVDLINGIFDLILEYESNPNDAIKESLNTHYQAWIDHTIEHFKGEEVMMAEKRFPPYPFHKGEHDRALMIMNKVFQQWEQSDDIMVLKRYFIEELPLWLENHIKSMDTVTAMFFRTGLSPCAIH